MGVLRWEDPPATGYADPRDSFDSHAVAADLRAHPDRWGLIRISPGSYGLAWHVRTGRQLSAFRPAGSFEAVARSTPAGIATYARYVGGES